MSSGNVSQFSEVPKKTKDRSRSKVKEPTKETTEGAPQAVRGGRSRGGFEGTRGTRGRGRGSARGGRGASTTANQGSRQAAPTSVTPNAETPSWDSVPATDAGDNTWDQSAGVAKWDSSGDDHVSPEAPVTAKPEGPKSNLIPEGGTKKSWASMFATSKPAPPPSKSVAAAPVSAKGQVLPEAPISAEEITRLNGDESEVTAPPQIEETPPIDPPTIDTGSIDAPLPETTKVEITPSKDELTEDNLEHLPDVSNPAPAGTAASTAASSRDPRSMVGSATPLTASQQQPAPIGRPPMGGYATNAYRATGQPGRSASFQRRILEQEEAVVMPGNHAVDRTAVQFGSMGLNGDAEASPLDVDEDREEAETRTQPPHPSPPPQPRASLPPAPRQPSAPMAEAPSQEVFGTPKPAPGLPPVPQQQPSQENIGAPGLTQPGTQVPPGYSQFGARYNQSNTQHETSAPTQKPYDPFGHQGLPPSQFDYPAHSQAPGQPRQQGFAGFTSAAHDMPSNYTSNEQRNAYQNYYGSFGDNASSQQDVGASQQRAASGFGAAAGGSAFPTSQAQQVSQRSRHPFHSTLLRFFFFFLNFLFKKK